MKYVMGIDIGTTGCKVNIYNEKLISYGSSYRSYEIISDMPGWAEEDPIIWWKSTKDAIKECLTNTSVLSKDIVSLGISCTNGIVPVDENGNHTYNAIMQIDNRTIKQAMKIKDLVGSRVIFETTGNRIAQGTFSSPIILWLKENEPDIYKNTFNFLSPTGYIVQKMTGRFTFDHTRASTSLLYDINNKDWSMKICSLLEIDMNKLPKIYNSEEVVGYITEKTAEETGLFEGMPVVAGVMDSVAACVGLGTTTIDNPALIVGTVARLCIPQLKQEFDHRFLNSAFVNDVPFLSMTPVNAGGLSIKWFVENFLDKEKKLLLEDKEDFYKYFEKKASEIPPGSNQLLYLPYLVGERSPIWDPDARGMFFGVKLSHTKYHFYRAIMEGVAFAIRHNLEIYTSKYGTKINRITISGGGAKSKLWASIFADILGLPVVIPNDVESETKGSAIFAGFGVEMFNSLNDILPKEDIITIQPNSNNTKLYDLLFHIYKDLYSNCIKLFKDLQRI